MQPNATILDTPTPVQPYKNVAFDEYLSFCALGGLLTTDDGKLSKMTLSDFCARVGIDRATAYRWKHNTSNFSDKVRQRRDEIFPFARETACWNRLYLIGLQSGDLKAAVQALTLLLGHFSGLMLPSQPERASSYNPTNLAEMFAEADKIMNAEQEGIVSSAHDQ
jgi:hypothetical protein